MKVIKPSKLGVLTRGFEHNRQFYMGVSVLAFIPLAEAPTLLPEAAMWPFCGERLGAEGALDVGIPKARGEYLINGFAHAPNGVPSPYVDVRARVGNLSKLLRVTGERVWLSSSRHSEPVPFTDMRLSWANAFGGPEYAKNPLGKGVGETTLHGQKVQLLPNLEDPRAPVSSARDRPEPVGFGPIDLSWPQRQRLAGTHDQYWLDNLFPGFARDIDWSFFNIAAPDQHCAEFWQGGEHYEFVNLHPSKPVLAGVLPRWHARVFVRRTSAVGPGVTARAKVERAAEERAAREANANKPPPVGQLPQMPAPPDIRDHELEEVPLRLQTLWFFPDAARAVLIWQGSLRVITDDCTDITHLLLGADDLEQLRPRGYFAEQLRDRLHPELGPMVALDDRPLLPAQLEPSPPLVAEGMPMREGLLEANLHAKRMKEFERARAVVASYGLDPDEHGPPAPEPPPPPPKPEEVAAITAKQIEEAKLLEAKTRADVAARQAKLEVELDEAGVPGMNSEILRKELETKPTGPPTFSAAANRALLEDVAQECRAAGWINDEVEGMLVDKDLHERWLSAEAQGRQVYRLNAHTQEPAPELAPEQSAEKRALLLQRVAAGERINDLNFTGADLSKLDLRNADLSDGWFERARFDGSDLSGAKLDESVLAHASMVGTKLDDASAVKANFGNARIADASLIGVDFSDAILNKTRIARSSLVRVKLSRADLLGIELEQVDASEAMAEQMVINEATVSGLKLVAAKFERCLFIGLDLGGADLSQLELLRCAFINCELQKTNFREAKFNSVAFVEACILTQAVFVGARLQGCNLREIPLDGADFTQAQLDRADLSGASLVRAVFYRASAIEARFDKADLSDASLLAANLMNASFMNATICGADLRGANLFGADMARVRTDRRVRLDDALLTKVRVNPKHVEAQ